MFTKIILFISLIAIILSAPLKDKKKREIIVDRTGFYLNTSAKYYTTEPSPLFDIGRPVANQLLNLLQRPFNVVQHPFNDQILKQMPFVNRLTKDNSTTKPSVVFDLGGPLANPWLNPYTHLDFRRNYNDPFTAQRPEKVPIYLPKPNYEYNKPSKQVLLVNRLTKDKSTTEQSEFIDIGDSIANSRLDLLQRLLNVIQQQFAALKLKQVPIYQSQPNYEYIQQPKQEPSVKRVTKDNSTTKPSVVFDLGGPLANPWLNPYTPPLHRPFKRLQNQFNDQKAGQFPFYLPNY